MPPRKVYLKLSLGLHYEKINRSKIELDRKWGAHLIEH